MMAQQASLAKLEGRVREEYRCFEFGPSNIQGTVLAKLCPAYINPCLYLWMVARSP